jgi:F0F1-type ATP synthase membrane subunit b/b'
MLSVQQLSSGRITEHVSLDEQIRLALDRAAGTIRTHLEEDLAAFTDELKRAALVERSHAIQQAADAAAAEVRRQAEAHIAQLRDAAHRQADEIRRAAEAQVAELRKSLHAQLDDVRRMAQAQITESTRRSERDAQEARRLAEREIEDARRLASAQVDDVQRRSEELLDETRRDYEARIEEARRRGRADVEALRAEIESSRRAAEAAAEEVLIAQLATAQAQAEERTARAVERTRTDAFQAELAQSARLLDAIRILDDGRALGEVLDALAECAGREVERAAVFVVKGERLRGWRLIGFPDAGPAKNIEVDLDGAGLAGAVVRTGVTVSRPTVAPGDEEGTRQPALPPFALTAGPRHAMAVPIIVGGEVVAVLYADAPRLDTPSSASRWPAVLEILARHGSRALEAMTVQQAAGLSLPRPVARASHSPLPGPVEHGGGSSDEDAARRYARLLLSEIRMYHEPLVDEGRRSRDLRRRLRGEIDRARKLYEARVPPAIREQSDFFEQELVRTLADGDRTLLG